MPLRFLKGKMQRPHVCSILSCRNMTIKVNAFSVFLLCSAPSDIPWVYCASRAKWFDKLVVVKSFKADVSSISPSSGWVANYLFILFHRCSTTVALETGAAHIMLCVLVTLTCPILLSNFSKLFRKWCSIVSYCIFKSFLSLVFKKEEKITIFHISVLSNVDNFSWFCTCYQLVLSCFEGSWSLRDILLLSLPVVTNG